MATAIDIRELPARLDEALAVTAAGGEVILVDGSTPRARLMPLGSAVPRTAGLHPGALQTTPDFDAPLPDEFWGGPPTVGNLPGVHLVGPKDAAKFEMEVAWEDDRSAEGSARPGVQPADGRGTAFRPGEMSTCPRAPLYDVARPARTAPPGAD